MANTINGVHLPDDLIWVDEFDTSQVAQNVQRSLTGAFIVQTSLKQVGRLMSLQGDDAWVTRAEANLIRAVFESHDGSHMTLIYRGETFTVIPNLSSGVAFTATPLIDQEDPDDTDKYSTNINLYIVQ